MLGEIILVGSIGSLVIVAASVDNKLERSGKHVESDLLHKAVKLVLSCGGLGGLCWLIWKTLIMFV